MRVSAPRYVRWLLVAGCIADKLMPKGNGVSRSGNPWTSAREGMFWCLLVLTGKLVQEGFFPVGNPQASARELF
ncbi:MAG: hypothetical protein A3C16_04435 [Candidatus Sungbacteria bacterium RIFCSPHIGHO2_02_FULL_51_29]|uniref:Uncharacterized protein n=1 Tax=Candidatus Sungbacteria bacterium RIFCSPHIGHO2_02_FULL_51_29 TaxID=1802273 RepID=A0A1G2KQG8_9BACT|nr:MAG: hypothetical protein A3C16_04435 [Candidatus Sungbacteria bacterium RIFCSPHIGHO2_02_FULL_51_29]